MELLSVNRARSIWLLPLVDLNPYGRYTLTKIPSVAERYRFMQWPTKLEELDPAKGIKFTGGTFTKSDQTDIGVEVVIYSDGLIADTRSSTDDSDSFLDDLLKWHAEDHGDVPYQKILRRKLYVSELWVRPEKPLSSLHRELQTFSERLTALISDVSPFPIRYEFSTIMFSAEPGRVSPPAPFRFERALDVPFDEERYFSVAPLPTSIHLQMLNEFEKIFIRGKKAR